MKIQAKTNWMCPLFTLYFLLCLAAVAQERPPVAGGGSSATNAIPITNGTAYNLTIKGGTFSSLNYSNGATFSTTDANGNMVLTNTVTHAFSIKNPVTMDSTNSGVTASLGTFTGNGGGLTHIVKTGNFTSGSGELGGTNAVFFVNPDTGNTNWILLQ